MLSFASATHLSCCESPHRRMRVLVTLPGHQTHAAGLVSANSHHLEHLIVYSNGQREANAWLWPQAVAVLGHIWMYNISALNCPFPAEYAACPSKACPLVAFTAGWGGAPWRYSPQQWYSGCGARQRFCCLGGSAELPHCPLICGRESGM